MYGPNLRALAVYLLVFQHIPVARTATLIADVTGARPRPAGSARCCTTVADLLVDVEKLIKSLIVLAHVIHVDETTQQHQRGPVVAARRLHPKLTALSPAPLPRAGRR